MTRTDRMVPVQRVMDDSEKQHARSLAAAQRRVGEAEAKLAELQRYHVDYAQSFSRRATAGSSGLALRDFQAFLTRLAEAAKAQEQIVARAREDLAAETHHWQGAARRAKAIGVVVDRWRGEELRVQERREQQETDERAQQMLRPAARALG
jgi:flagellar FliJ protein